MKRWQDREWRPNEAERQQLRIERQPLGETLLRCLDERAIDTMEGWGMTEGEMAREDVWKSQGQYLAYREIMGWLEELVEEETPGEDSASSETNEVL